MNVTEATSARDQNNHVREYLDYYISFPHPPHFAVLLNGPWGIGKTFLVKKFLKDHFSGNTEEYVYVSLYGLASAKEIDDALLAAIYPVLSGKGAKIVGRIMKSVLSYKGVSTDLSFTAFLNKFKAKLYIFDDLERCEIRPINAVLGYINEFIEHDDCKVIIVANESEIDESDDYRRKREKLIGKTLEVRSSFEDAFAFFLTSIDNSQSKYFIGLKQDDIYEVYCQSELNNLRILQQTMWDFERIFIVLSAAHQNNMEAMSSLLAMFFALSFEIKSGKLSKLDLESRAEGMMAWLKKNDEPTAFQRSLARYPEIDLSSSMLSNELLVDILINGIVDASKVRESLDRSSFFVKSDEEPAWRTVWYSLERTEEQFNRALGEFERQFIAREFTGTGVILHVFGLRLQLVDMGVVTMSRADVVAQCKQYVDDIFNAKKIEPIPLDSNREDFRFNGYGGLGIYQAESFEYKELYTYLRDKRQLAAVDLLPTQAEKLLIEMQADPALYYRRLCLTNSPDNIYYQVPILACIEPEQFVQELLAQTPAHQRIIFSAFEGRYKHQYYAGGLSKERLWLGEVTRLLSEASQAMSILGRYRLSKLMEWYVTPFLQDPDNAQ